MRLSWEGHWTDDVPEWDQSIGPAFVPRVREGVGILPVDDGHAVLVNDFVRDPVVLDPLSAAIWSAFDGFATIAELAEDLSWSLGNHIDFLAVVTWLSRALCADRFLVIDSAPAGEVLPRYRRPSAASCLGKRLGLGRAWLSEVDSPTGDRITVAGMDRTDVEDLTRDLRSLGCSTLPPHRLVGRLERRELILLRSTDGRAPRLQRVFDNNGAERFATRDRELATWAFRSTANSVLFAPSPLSVDGPIPLVGDDAVIFHPALRARLLAALRLRGRSSPPLVRAGTATVTPDGQVLEAPSVLGGASTSYPLRAIVIPPGESEGDRARSVVQIARRWSPAALDVVQALLASTPIVTVAPTDVEVDAVIDRLGLG